MQEKHKLEKEETLCSNRNTNHPKYKEKMNKMSNIPKMYRVVVKLDNLSPKEIEGLTGVR